MYIDLDNSPDLTMEELTKQLFDNEFLSDIQFRVEGKILFAHSWELMKRSIVFRKQFRYNLGNNSPIPVEGITYKAFYKFLRFIYTDQFDTEAEEGLRSEIYKLAVGYKILQLENIVLKMPCGIEMNLKLFEFSVVNKYEVINNFVLDDLIRKFKSVAKLNTFYDIREDVAEKIIKFNQIPNKMAKFNAFVQWMNRSGLINQIPLSQRQLFFNILLRLIQFPGMTFDEFRLCVQNQPDLLKSNDIPVISQKMIKHYENQKWDTNRRLELVNPVSIIDPDSVHRLATSFAVSDNLMLCGFKCGNASTNYEIHISAKHSTQRCHELIDILSYQHDEFGKRPLNYFNFNESIKLMPHVDYRIDINHTRNASVYCRKSNMNCTVVGPSELVTFKAIGDNLFEIFFELPAK